MVTFTMAYIIRLLLVIEVGQQAIMAIPLTIFIPESLCARPRPSGFRCRSLT